MFISSSNLLSRRFKNTKTYQTMSRYSVWKCDSINSYMRGIDTVYNCLSNSPIIQKQILCLMPVGCTSMPSKWEEIKDCKFYAINGQHTTVATRRMLKDPLCNRKEGVWHWNTLIVWSANNLDLKSISNHYNLVNKINPFKATWRNNLSHARETWVSMGRPRQVWNNSKGPLVELVK
jgi:hypothetical protein